MGGVEDDAPPRKRVRTSLVDSQNLLDSLSCHLPADPLRSSMIHSLSSQGKELMIGHRQAIKRDEFVRIIVDALYCLGYEKTGELLEQESGVQLRSPDVDILRKQILDGSWNDAVSTLHKLQLDDITTKSAAFLILEHKFFELLAENSFVDAMHTLRGEITPLKINLERVHELCSCLVSSSQLMLSDTWKPGLKHCNSRFYLLEEMQKLLPPHIMLPERRLEHLVELALSVQREACYFHNSLDHLSLYVDHACGKDQIPSQTTQVLTAHLDEVWYLKFSNNGYFLASSSSDKTAIIWEVHEDGGLSLKHVLRGHEKSVLMVAWSPDDSQLLTCGMEEAIRRWDVHSGECLHVYQKPGLGLVSCAWFPDGKQLISGVTDKTYCSWDLDGKELNTWKGQRSSTTPDFVVTRDGRFIISMNRENSILLLEKETELEKVIKEEQTITSFSVSHDSGFLLINLVNEEIHLWNIRSNPQLLMGYKGHKRHRFVIRSCFGGSDEAFIASGSEDSQVYIWHRGTGDLIEVLPGHSGTVNCVSWNPANPQMLASASDDRTIRIWGIQKVSWRKQGNSTDRAEVHNNCIATPCNGSNKPSP